MKGWIMYNTKMQNNILFNFYGMLQSKFVSY